jgi:hypothetical protein
MGYRAHVPGFAIAILKVAAWVNLLIGVGLTFTLSLVGVQLFGAKGTSADFVRIALELLSAVFGFSGWALLLVVANMAEQLDRISAQLSKPADE